MNKYLVRLRLPGLKYESFIVTTMKKDPNLILEMAIQKYKEVHPNEVTTILSYHSSIQKI